MKELAEDLEKNISLGENTEKYIAFTVPIEKKVKSIYEKGEKNYKNIYLKCYNLLTAQDLWQAHYQIL